MLSDEYHCCVHFPDEETGAREMKMLPYKLKIRVQEPGETAQWFRVLTALPEDSQHLYVSSQPPISWGFDALCGHQHVYQSKHVQDKTGKPH